MKYFPLNIELNKKLILLVGGGEVAERKLDLLVKAKAQVIIMSPTFTDYLQTFSDRAELTFVDSEYKTSILDEYKFSFVIAATNNEDLNKKIAKDANEKNILVNVVDRPEICDFIFPSILERGPVTVSVSTGGASPVLARMLRTKLETSIPGGYGKLAKIVSDNRVVVRKKFKNFKSNRIFWEEILNSKFVDLVLSGQEGAAEKFLEKEIENFDENKKSEGEVYLVGAGPGDPDLLTFRALRLMQQADIVLYDRLVHPDIIELVRRDAQKIYVGKKRDQHTVRQDEINQLLVKYAKEGNRVLRLKGGDPFIFGRGGEEIETLLSNGLKSMKYHRCTIIIEKAIEYTSQYQLPDFLIELMTHSIQTIRENTFQHLKHFVDETILEISNSGNNQLSTRIEFLTLRPILETMIKSSIHDQSHSVSLNCGKIIHMTQPRF